jgi:hypothetical protein
MPSEAAKYLHYARECARLASEAPTKAQHDRLLDLARV